MKLLNFTLLFIVYIISISLIKAEDLSLVPGPIFCEYKSRDINSNYSNPEATIKCKDLNCSVNGSGVSVSTGLVTIKSPGTYIIQGTLDGQLRIEVRQNDIVHLVLKGITIISNEGPAIYGYIANKIIITLVGNNKLVDSPNYDVANGEPDACLFINSNLTINGSGTLSVTGNYSDAIKCKNDLKIVNGNIIVPTSVQRGIKAKNSICIRNGSIDIKSKNSGIKVTRVNNSDKGFITVDGGKISISTLKNGIRAETHLTIRGGYIDVKDCAEGIKAQMIDILGGEIHIDATDDGINASKISINNNDSEDSLNDSTGNSANSDNNGANDHNNWIDDSHDNSNNNYNDDNKENNNENENENNYDNEYNNTDHDTNNVDDNYDNHGNNDDNYDNNDNNDNNNNNDDNDDNNNYNDDENENNDLDNNGDSKYIYNNLNIKDQSVTGTDGSVYINIVGGKTYVSVSGDDADGINSKGVVYIGGEAEVYTSIEGRNVNGKMIALNAKGDNSIVNNSTVIATAVNFNGLTEAMGSIGKTCIVYQPYIQTSINNQDAGTKISLKDKDDNVIASYTPNVSYSSIFISSPSITPGETYIIYYGDDSITAVASNAASGYSSPPSVISPADSHMNQSNGFRIQPKFIIIFILFILSMILN